MTTHKAKLRKFGFIDQSLGASGPALGGRITRMHVGNVGSAASLAK